MKKAAYYASPETGIDYFTKVKNEPSDTEIKVVRSKYGQWADKWKGTTAAKVKDDGNRVIVSLEDGKFIALDYSELNALFVLFREYRRHVNSTKYSRILIERSK